MSKAEAHVGIDPDPSEGETNSCSDLCHQSELGHYWQDSVHATQSGYKALFTQRSGGLTLEGHPEFEQGFTQDCSPCHASCGDCHISSPKNVGGGLVAGHRINRVPDQQRNCTACHGSRVGDEYTGANPYAGVDAHMIPGRMTCMDCHGAEEMHGTPGANPQHRYEEPNLTKCVDCHADAPVDPNLWHVMHASEDAVAGGRSLQCQVCHSQDYKSCNGCHVGEGITGSSYQTFKIGHNPRAEQNGFDYAVLRHVPLAVDTYRGWGLDQLADFSSVETWKYASPHNIRRFTARTDTTGGQNGCSACHQTEDSPAGWFLRQSDLDGLGQAEQDANLDLIVPEGDANTWSK